MTDNDNEIVFDNYERILVDLTLGLRAPANEAEERLMKQINEIVEKGHIVEIPHEFY